MSIPQPPYCTLGRLQSKGMNIDWVKIRGWRKQGIFVVNLMDERLSWPERELVKQLGEKLYGKQEGDFDT